MVANVAPVGTVGKVASSLALQHYTNYLECLYFIDLLKKSTIGTSWIMSLYVGPYFPL